uniref:Uncharacterized protein n=1 Tax=Bos indicus x Bos taurus TaxID=30522 RepID=A0A4W2G527_BOBOX
SPGFSLEGLMLKLKLQSSKRQKGRGKPSSFGDSCATLLPLACVPEASAPTLGFPATGLPGLRTDGVRFALSLQWVPFVLPSPQVASLPFGHSQRVRGLSFPSLLFLCLFYSPQSFKIGFVLAKKKKKSTNETSNININVYSI